MLSASRVTAPLMPVGPLHFEGALGWKGSAATGAFRPSSLRGVPESVFTLSAGRSNSSSKASHSLLNIDLNVEMSSRRPERLEFDLHQLSEGGAPLDLQTEQDLFHHKSGHHNQSSSLSSSKQPSLRNIDLNDQPTTANDLASARFYLKPSQSFIESGSVKSDDSTISIMGMRVEVNGRNSSVKPFPLSNGRILIWRDLVLW
ncbi:hypothetical protein Leryth_010627 [Lithospermum erythrorhizon]|nr:hypothetical protein Leryth_010627 [Lithospermum erythrorhizon]